MVVQFKNGFSIEMADVEIKQVGTHLDLPLFEGYNGTVTAVAFVDVPAIEVGVNIEDNEKPIGKVKIENENNKEYIAYKLIITGPVMIPNKMHRNDGYIFFSEDSIKKYEKDYIKYHGNDGFKMGHD